MSQKPFSSKSISFLFVALFVILLSLLTMSSVFAQLRPDPARTPGAGPSNMQGNPQATADAMQRNIQATQAAMQVNATAMSGNPEAPGGGLQATVDSISTNIPATADALSSRAALTDLEYVATANALRTAVPQQIQDVAGEELEAVLNAIDENLDVNFTEDGLSVTYAVQEAEFNAALDAALAAGGYGYSDVAADFTPDGILITIEDFEVSENLSGRALALVAVAAVNGEAQATVIFVTINDVSVPDQYVAEINATIQSAADASVDSILGAYDYSVDALYTTDTTLVMSISVPLDVEVPAQ